MLNVLFIQFTVMKKLFYVCKKSIALLNNNIYTSIIETCR